MSLRRVVTNILLVGSFPLILKNITLFIIYTLVCKLFLEYSQLPQVRLEIRRKGQKGGKCNSFWENVLIADGVFFPSVCPGLHKGPVGLGKIIKRICELKIYCD